jgi:hypothetical protein
VQQLFQFLKEYFISYKNNNVNAEDKNPDVCKMLSTHLLPTLNELIIQNCLTRFIPEQTNELIQYERVIELTTDFENKLELLGTDCNGSRNPSLCEFEMSIVVLCNAFRILGQKCKNAFSLCKKC